MIRNLNIFNILFLHVSECVSFNFMIRFYFFIHSRKLPLSCGISILGLIFIYLFFHCLILKVFFCSIGQFSFLLLLLIKLPDIQENPICFLLKHFVFVVVYIYVNIYIYMFMMLMCFVFHYLITANIVRTRRFTDVKRVRLNGINITDFLSFKIQNSKTETRLNMYLEYSSQIHVHFLQ